MASQIETDVAMAVIVGEATIGRAFKNCLILCAYFGCVLKQQREHRGSAGCSDQS